MRIQHNIMAMNSYRNYTANTKALSKNLEKLSSGYKINRAGDDAAGLAISEKMRAQITGLKTAQKNAKDGISLVQTAEGALTEVHSMLNRMVELADQSANGTYDVETDRANLQKEFDALRSEIDRIADSTNFNGIKLLDGSLSSTGSAGAAGVPSFSMEGGLIEDVAAVKYKSNSAALDALTLAAGKKASYTVAYTNAAGESLSAVVDIEVKTVGTDAAGGSVKGVLVINGTEYTETDNTAAGFKADDLAAAISKELMKDSKFAATFKAGSSTADLTFEAKAGGAASKINGITRNLDGTTANVAMDSTGADFTAGADAYQKLTGVKQGDVFSVAGKKFAAFEDADAAQAAKDALTGDDVGKYDNVNFIYTGTNGSANIVAGDEPEIQAAIKLATGYDGASVDAAGEISFKSPTGTAGSQAAGGLVLQIGDTADDFNQLTVSVADMHAKALGISSISIAEQNDAKTAVQTIKDAINSVSGTRGGLGALQNRLEHTINNLSVMQENIQDAEASIRDVDVAEEMMAYTKNNILVQSAQAMLAQANQIPQGVLQLLQ